MTLTTRALCLILLIGLEAAVANAAGGLTWGNDLNQALQLAGQTNRLVLVHLGAPWCGPCAKLEREVFSQPNFGADLQRDFVAVKLNLDEHQQEADRWGVHAIPADVILAPNGAVIHRMASPQAGDRYVAALRQVASQARPPQQQTNLVAAAPSAPAVTPASAATNQPVAPVASAAPAPHPVGLDGCCAVTLVEKKQWIPGDARWGAIHEGRTYLFAGPAEQQQFMKNPNRYGPALAGHDPVLALEQRQQIPGSCELGLRYAERTYLFSSPDTLDRFKRDPARYAVPGGSVMR